MNSIPSLLKQDARVRTRSFNDTEKNYAYIEKNMMPIDNTEMSKYVTLVHSENELLSTTTISYWG